MSNSICHRTFLEKCCEMRGYTLDEVMQCVLEKKGDIWVIDVNHPAYPRDTRDGAVFSPNACGPGTELKGVLGRIGLSSGSDCKCNQRANHMDRMEAEQPGWCEANIEEIVGWLRESAAERGLPFVDIAARLLVRRAIANARRKESQRVEEQR